MAGLIAVAIQFIPVDRSNPPVEQDVAAPAAVKPVLRESCYDCHSNETTWPWYSYVAPASWLVAGDVHEAREHLNFSTWNRLSPNERADVIREVWKEVRAGEMPLPFYVLAHPSAKLTTQDRTALRDWARRAAEGGEDGDEDEEGPESD